MSKPSDKPFQIKLTKDLDERLARIASANNIAKSDVIRLVLTDALPNIEQNGITIRPTKKAA